MALGENRPLDPRLRVRAFLQGLALLVLMGVIDWASGPEIHVSVFYTLPIMYVAWLAGRWPTITLSIIGGVIWLVAELGTSVEYSAVWIPLWNAGARIVQFLIAGGLATTMAERKRTEQELLQTRNALLQAEVHERAETEIRLKEVNETLEQRVAERSAAAETRSLALTKSEAALRAQTKVLRSILDSMGDGVIVCNAAGEILLRNPEAERLLKWKTNEASVKSEQSAKPVELHPRKDHPLLRALHDNPMEGAELLVTGADSSEKLWLRTTGRPLIDDEGTTQGRVLVFSDVTAQRSLESQIAEISEREQRRIGQDLHDGLCQHLVSAAFASTSVQLKLAEQGLPEAKDVGEIGDLLKEGIAQARAIARGLHPVQLEAEGLTSALEELARSVESLTSISCQFQGDGIFQPRDLTTAANLYRIAQESVNNAVKHSKARHVYITLQTDPEMLSIRDDGIGPAHTSRKGSGMGLHIMNYRARMINACLEITTGPEGGTLIRCTLRN
jgi:PAS domain S-box-containing protein